MRINQFVAQATGLGRRKADKLIIEGKIFVNNSLATLGQNIEPTDTIKLGKNIINVPTRKTIIVLNKPAGYVCSREGQGSKTIYNLLPKEYSNLKSIGRLDKDSSGIIVLTDDGLLSQKLSHPSFNKQKIYNLKLNRDLTDDEINKISSGYIRLDKKPSVIKIKLLKNGLYEATLNEGRNRQIRRTLEKINVRVLELKRIQFGPYKLSSLGSKVWAIL